MLGFTSHEFTGPPTVQLDCLAIPAWRRAVGPQRACWRQARTYVLAPLPAAAGCGLLPGPACLGPVGMRRFDIATRRTRPFASRRAKGNIPVNEMREQGKLSKTFHRKIATLHCGPMLLSTRVVVATNKLRRLGCCVPAHRVRSALRMPGRADRLGAFTHRRPAWSISAASSNSLPRRLQRPPAGARGPGLLSAPGRRRPRRRATPCRRAPLGTSSWSSRTS
jgi:hypothetical protein